MGSDYSLVFDNNLVEKVITRTREVRDYNNFSSGEKKRIDLSILLALMDIAKVQNSVDTNILVLDEVLDTSMDNEGVESFLFFLKNGFKQLYGDKCIYIITHRNDISADTFDRIVALKKTKNFTIIDKIVEMQP
jgi:DNA repair exonuclease SbcCD ATPase subunit